MSNDRQNGMVAGLLIDLSLVNIPPLNRKDTFKSSQLFGSGLVCESTFMSSWRGNSPGQHSGCEFGQWGKPGSPRLSQVFLDNLVTQIKFV